MADPTEISIRLIANGGPPICDRYVDFDNNANLAAQGVARLVSAEVFRAPADWGTIHVRGVEVVPLASYTILVKCNFSPTPSLAPAVNFTMKKWGDCVGAFDGNEWSPPDGIVTISDAVAVLDAFRGLPSAPPKYQVDMHPDKADYVIDILDIVSALNGFQGKPAPTDCNSNGRGDYCDVVTHASGDCNDNSIPDECDSDCDGDGIPNDCEAGPEDCDNDGVTDCQDACLCSTPPDRPCVCPGTGRCCFPDAQICFDDYPRSICLAQGGVPDCVEYVCRSGCIVGDFDHDGDIDGDDYDSFAACYAGPGVSVTYVCLDGDFDGDFDVDCDDWNDFKLYWTEPGSPPSLPQCP